MNDMISTSAVYSNTLYRPSVNHAGGHTLTEVTVAQRHTDHRPHVGGFVERL